MRAGYAPASSSFSPSPFPDIIPSPSRAAPVWRRLPPPRRLSDTAARVVAWRPRPGASPKAAPHGRPGRIARTSVAAHSRCLRATPIRKWPSRSAISGENIGGAGLSERTGLRRCRPWPRIAAAGEAIGPGTAVRDPLRPSCKVDLQLVEGPKLILDRRGHSGAHLPPASAPSSATWFGGCRKRRWLCTAVFAKHLCSSPLPPWARSPFPARHIRLES